jgi:hypothetical protein
MTAHLQFRAIGMILILALQINLFAQTEEPTGLLGDNFSLESALEEFKKAKSLEDFEKALNDEDKHVHNLDLNRDKEIDYLRVNDHMDNDVHAIVISAAVGKDESQDIAVIEIEKDGDKSATLQIVGDVDLYGEDMIVKEEVRRCQWNTQILWLMSGVGLLSVMSMVLLMSLITLLFIGLLTQEGGNRGNLSDGQYGDHSESVTHQDIE